MIREGTTHLSIYNLENQRRSALARTLELIEANEVTLRGLALENPRRLLLIVLLKRLRAQADRLEAGLVKPGSRAC